MLVIGNSQVQYADRIVEVKTQAWTFSIHIFRTNGVSMKNRTERAAPINPHLEVDPRSICLR